MNIALNFKRIKVLLVLILFGGSGIVLSALILPTFIQSSYELGSYRFENEQSINAELDVSVSNNYSLTFSFEPKDFEANSDWLKFMGEHYWKEGKLAFPGEPFEVEITATRQNGKSTLHNVLVEGSFPCPTYRRCRYSPTFFLESGINALNMTVKSGNSFFKGKEFDLQLNIASEPSRNSSIIYWVSHLSMGFFLPALLVIVISSILTLVVCVINKPNRYQIAL